MMRRLALRCAADARPLGRRSSSAVEASSAGAAPAPTFTVTRVPARPAEAAVALPATSLSDDALLQQKVRQHFPVRSNWTKAEIQAIYDAPLLELVRDAGAVHRAYWDAAEVQTCTLLSIKTGGCTEDCGYCSQSVRHKTHVKPTKQMIVDDVVNAAKRAKAAGSTRFCMGAAWRELGNKNKAFQDILDMVRQISGEGMEVCATLGMLNAEQAADLKKAGLTAYNHNLDTSAEFYPTVVTTRTYQERLDTIGNVRGAGLSVCTGGILGLGEAEVDRVSLLHTLATLPHGHPESVPINALVAVKGTKMEENVTVTSFDMTRMIAAARIVMPRAMVRLSAGRMEFSQGEQALMFLAGANSIFNGDVLLTTANPGRDEDAALFDALGIKAKKPTQRHDSAAE
ncbi:hypothetical protein M885DRAFT_543182 [Pelagophyceae sp. CCMP2097]|nr:hypothetical protein M885DRAFT_543182 [Pelagophyceae sp. CCMP2097]